MCKKTCNQEIREAKTSFEENPGKKQKKARNHYMPILDQNKI